MKNIFTLVVLFYFAYSGAYSQNHELETYLLNLPKEELNQAEIDGIILMREEEKLAHDVYLTLYDKWSTNIFNNIASSEQTHMDWVGVLIEKYGLEDPMLDGRGVFTSSHMQGLYDTLVAIGSESIEQGFFIGCTIEDLDIYDLEELIKATDNVDIQTVYQNLTLGSRNHMRSFYKQYENRGLTYTEQYITHEELAAILDHDMENGPVDHNGDPLVITDVEEETNPAAFNSRALSYPNPFSSTTSIEFNLNRAAAVSINIYDNSGALVKNLVRGIHLNNGPNSIIWDGADNSGAKLNSGVYIYQIYSNNELISGQIILER